MLTKDVLNLTASTMKDELSHKVLRVRFRKKSTGEERIMICTNHDSVVNQDGIRPKNPNPKRPENLITTYDLEKNGWRTFYFDNVIRVEELPAQFKKGEMPNVDIEA